jgi:hercynine metabolism protein
VSWLDELEARLEQQLEAFLASNPAQDALLREQEARDRQARLIGRRRQLQRDADRLRSGLLQRAGEIRQWRQRVERARAAGADELAARAESHLTQLMDQGRRQWQQLEALGQEFGQLEQQLRELSQQAQQAAAAGTAGGAQTAGAQTATAQAGAAQAAPEPNGSDLERAWAAFETEQELEALRRSKG